MALPTSYLITTKNLDSLLNSILGAKAPDKFSTKFITELGFSSSNDRLYVGVFKSLGLINENGDPTQVYFDFLDQSQSKVVLARAIMNAYEDLFSIKKDAYKMTTEEVKNKLKTLTQGKSTDNVYSLMANTFTALCNWADFSKIGNLSKQTDNEKQSHNEHKDKKIEDDVKEKTSLPSGIAISGLHYNIQIHLPETRDPQVYDAIFSSLKKHLGI